MSRPRQTPHRVNPVRPRPGRVPKQRPAPKPATKKRGCGPLAATAAMLAVLSVSVALVPFALPVWAGKSMASWTAHGGFMVALLVAAVVLYLGVSLLISPAGPRVWGARSSRPGPAPEPAAVSALRGTAGSGAPGGAA